MNQCLLCTRGHSITLCPFPLFLPERFSACLTSLPIIYSSRTPFPSLLALHTERCGPPHRGATPVAPPDCRSRPWPPPPCGRAVRSAMAALLRRRPPAGSLGAPQPAALPSSVPVLLRVLTEPAVGYLHADAPADDVIDRLLVAPISGLPCGELCSCCRRPLIRSPSVLTTDRPIGGCVRAAGAR